MIEESNIKVKVKGYDDLIPASLLLLGNHLLSKTNERKAKALRDEVFIGIDVQDETVVLLEADEETIIDSISFGG